MLTGHNDPETAVVLLKASFDPGWTVRVVRFGGHDWKLAEELDCGTHYADEPTRSVL